MENCYFTIGRKGKVCIPDQTVSKQHAEVWIKNGEIYLRDLNSTNGTFLVKNFRQVQFREGYVQLNQVLAFGRIRCSVQKLLELAGADDGFAPDGTTQLEDESRPLHLSHPRYKTSHSDITHLADH